MKKWMILLLCGALVLCLTACVDKPEAPTPSTEPTEEDYEKVYVDNVTVNEFITDIYENSDLALQGTSRGSKPDQYILYTNGCEVTVYPTEYGLYADICGGKTEADLERALSLFRHLTQIADSSANRDQLDAAVEKMSKPDSSFAEYRVSNYVKILRYRSLTETPGVSVDCHIELLLMNYRPPVSQE